MTAWRISEPLPGGRRVVVLERVPPTLRHVFLSRRAGLRGLRPDCSTSEVVVELVERGLRNRTALRALPRGER
ncbi:MAG: hypothetical protein ACRD0B_00435 [Acidimicrobiales bacterium]